MHGTKFWPSDISKWFCECVLIPSTPSLSRTYLHPFLSFQSREARSAINSLPHAKDGSFTILLHSNNVHACEVIHVHKHIKYIGGRGLETEGERERGREGVVGRERETRLRYWISSWSFISIRSWVTPHALVPLQWLPDTNDMVIIAAHKVLYYYMRSTVTCVDVL